ncbi:hypothetical protein OAP38_03315 [Opitutales bacterium]|nr:hypothetical protein [Opitutales bacterium]MDC0646754.1 hypothetical protein [Opitutales bacterium]
MTKEKYLNKTLFVTLAIACSTIFTYYYFLYTNVYPPGSFTAISEHTAHKVFQTRLLVTTLANFLEPSLPILIELFQWAVPYPIDYEVILQLLNIFFLVVLLVSLPRLLSNIEIFVNPAFSLIIFIPVSWNFIFLNGLIDGAGLYYPYDIPSLSFFTLGLLLFLEKKWRWFYFVFTLALLNRESACFISIAGFALSLVFTNPSFKNWIKENKDLIFHISIQLILWITSRVCLSIKFKDNPGVFLEQPHSMIEFLSKIFTGESHWAMQNPLWFLTLFFGLWVLPILGFKYLNNPSKRLIIVGTIYLFTLTLRSNMMETRVYNELNVILTILVICVLHNLINRTKSVFNTKISNA